MQELRCFWPRVEREHVSQEGAELRMTGTNTTWLVVLGAAALAGCSDRYDLVDGGGTPFDLAVPDAGILAGRPGGSYTDPATAIDVPALIPSYADTTIDSVTAVMESLSQPMVHTSTAVPADAYSTCGNCHINLDGGSFFPGNLHSSLANLKLAQPVACADCHTATMPTGFVGPLATAPARTPPTGEMKHDAVVWTKDGATTTPIVTADCGSCHGAPSQSLVASWATSPSGGAVQYHASLTAASIDQPSSCVDCHANSRPSTTLTSATAALPAGLSFDHTATEALGECTSCHSSGLTTQWTSWAKAVFHTVGSSTPATCLPCHAGERPTSTAAWKSPTYKASPFDYVANSQGRGHGGDQDCARCHNGPGSGAWGSTQDWVGGKFAHGPGTLAATTCIGCHVSQRPDLQPGANAAAVATAIGFDHALNGTGDCFGCHQATVSANHYVDYFKAGTTTLPGGDWMGGTTYPGSVLVGSSTQFISITEINLTRSAATSLITGMTSITTKLYNEMLHISSVLPASLNAGPSGSPDNAKCWHCHTNTNGTVTAFADGQYHSALTNYRATPGGAVMPIAQPTTQCTDCHTQMRPVGIVEKGGSSLIAMDHDAQFTAPVTIGGASVTSVTAIDCAVCHHMPGNVWSDGLFHAQIGAAQPKDCAVCHYPLMADAASDVVSTTKYQMKHRSGQMTTQSCQTCHTTALASGATQPSTAALWKPGVFHPAVAKQPTACIDCHNVSKPSAATQSSLAYTLPAGATASNGAQWMSHSAVRVTGVDCVTCHAADAKTSGSAWTKSTAFHSVVTNPATCQECHGLTNGAGGTPGTNNNMPAGLSNSTMKTSAAANVSTGIPAGTLDQISHADPNVTGHDCNFCHTQVGPSAALGIKGREWAIASFHDRFTAGSPLQLDVNGGRCSTCHMNVRPGAAFGGQDHSGFTAAPGTQDCNSCHSWPGTGTAAAPNWLGAKGGQPVSITVGGFNVSQPPATSVIKQGNINGLPHPTVSGALTCTSCHTMPAGGRGAFAYDHASALINTNCNSCHEAGSDLVGTVWNKATTAATGAGDTRPYTLTSITAKYKGDSRNVTYPKHFYPVDCSQCHAKPAGLSMVTTGAAYTAAWTFPHTQSKMTNPSTCVMCHTNGIPD